MERPLEIAEVKLLELGSTEDTGQWCKTISMLGREIIHDCTDRRTWGGADGEGNYEPRDLSRRCMRPSAIPPGLL